VSLYRGVYAVAFDEGHADPVATQQLVFDVLLRMNAVSPGDRVLLTMGQQGVTGGTNSMQILTVPGSNPAASA
jgi:pyruvate kinase